MVSHSKQTCSVILGETSYGPNSSYEKVHTDFCKYTLNMSKYASTDACLGELGRYPIINTISLYCMKYWLRLEQGTKNKPLNEAWQITKDKMLPWAENIRHLLYRNGYGMAWENPGCIEPRGFGRLFLEMCRIGMPE